MFIEKTKDGNSNKKKQCEVEERDEGNNVHSCMGH